MLSKRVFTVRKVKVLPSNEFDLLMFTNSGFSVRKVEICEVLSRNEDAQESHLQ